LVFIGTTFDLWRSIAGSGVIMRMTVAEKLRELVATETSSAPSVVGRTGASAQIAPLLPTVRQLHNDGHTWDSIARGLSQLLDLYQINRRTTQAERLTGRRLSALISALDAKQKKRDRKTAARTQRQDLVRPIEKQFSLSRDFAVNDMTSHTRSIVSQETLRRDAYAELQTMMRKDPS
jgi:hypothetical protein